MRLVALYGFLTLTLVGPACSGDQHEQGHDSAVECLSIREHPVSGRRFLTSSNTHAGRLGATIAGGSYTGVPPGAIPPHGRQRTVVVPYAYPVFYGGGYGGITLQSSSRQNVTVVVPQQQVPQVIINNGYVPETANPALREYGEKIAGDESSSI